MSPFKLIYMWDFLDILALYEGGSDFGLLVISYIYISNNRGISDGQVGPLQRRLDGFGSQEAAFKTTFPLAVDFLGWVE